MQKQQNLRLLRPTNKTTLATTEHLELPEGRFIPNAYGIMYYFFIKFMPNAVKVFTSRNFYHLHHPFQPTIKPKYPPFSLNYGDETQLSKTKEFGKLK